jgi:uncharacterized repeat protein (TIGR01451 family)
MSKTRQTRRIMAKALLYVAVVAVATASAAIAHGQSPLRPVPGAPSRVIAVPMQSTAIVAWLLPESSGDVAPITNYTVSAFDSEAPQTVASKAEAVEPAVEVSGVRSNHCYTFTVHATNAYGNGPESQPSESTCFPPPPGVGIQITMSAPASSGAGSELSFTLNVTNNGTGDAAMVTINDTLSSPLESVSVTQGACSGAEGATTFGCNLGALSAGTSATVTINLQMRTAPIMNSAWVAGLDANGTPLPDPVPGKNMASATVRTGDMGQSMSMSSPEGVLKH